MGATEAAPDHDPGRVIRTLWERMQARDWEGCEALLAPDVLVEWPATGERFRGRAAYLGVNKAYPEGWSITIIGILSFGEYVVSEVELPHEGVGVFAVMSSWTVRSGRITHGREYWITVAGDEPPDWRSAFAERYDGRPGPRL